jgi:hypothetical protein
MVGRDSVVGIATRYELDCPGIESRWGRGFQHPSRQALGRTKPLVTPPEEGLRFDVRQVSLCYNTPPYHKPAAGLPGECRNRSGGFVTGKLLLSYYLRLYVTNPFSLQVLLTYLLPHPPFSTQSFDLSIPIMLWEEYNL